MKKIVLLSITLIAAGFFAAVAQNNFTAQEKLLRPNASFEYPDFEPQKLPALKKTNSGSDGWIPDTVYCFMGGIKNIRNIFEYNSQGLLAVRTQQWWQNYSWVNGYSYTYTYDSNHNMLTELVQSWRNNSWVYFYSSAYVYTYDSNNNVLTKLEENSSLYTYTYDSDNNMQTRTYQIWENNSWVNSSLSTYTYDSDNNMQTLTYQIWENNSWINSVQITHTYDSNHNLLTELYQNRENNSWVNSDQITRTYDSNHNLLTELYRMWENNLWVNYRQNMIIYDENMNGISAERWWWSGESWEPPRNASMESLRLYYNNMQSVFEYWGCNKMTASYIKVSDLNTSVEPVAIPESDAASVYPNPTSGELRITNYESGIKDIQIFDLMGNKLPLRMETAKDAVDISHLSPGMYFIQITTEKGVVTKKIVKM
ncbi:MAG: T9SS type A sorting domain-containing protein [Candidatus Azobacteroides sp.]|nr:T9SS type A sorting domain-containing protein [Candidatus Azobacteroides sp.]